MLCMPVTVVEMLGSMDVRIVAFLASARQVASPMVVVGDLLIPILAIYRGVIIAFQLQAQVLHPHQLTTNAGWTLLSELIAVSQASTREAVKSVDVVGFQLIQTHPMCPGVSIKEARPLPHHHPQHHLLRLPHRHLRLPHRLLQLRRPQLHPLHHHLLDLCQVAKYSMQISARVV